VNTLAAKISLLVKDHGLRHRLGFSGRKTVQENYTFADYRRRLRDAISDGAARGITNTRDVNIPFENVS
jgi:hypothetical protein